MRRSDLVKSHQAKTKDSGLRLVIGNWLQRIYHAIGPKPDGFSMYLLQPEAKRPKRMDPADLFQDLMLRYLQVQEHFFPNERHPTISSDGVRVSTKDVNYYCIGGRQQDAERLRAAWAVMVVRLANGRPLS
jgi:hypothetical protein